MPQPPDEQSDLVTVSDDEGQIQSPTSSVKSDKGQSESDDVINNSVENTEIEQETESIEMDKEAGNEYENKSNHIGSADEEDIDDEIQELPQDESLTERLKNGASDDDLEEGGGSEDEDDEPEEGVNSSVTSSLMATEVLDNSVDSIIEDEGDDMEGSSVVTGKDRNTRNKRPVVDDEVMEIVEEDPLGAEEGSGIDEEDDMDETAVLSDEEDRDDDGDQERINNSRSPIPNSTSEFDNSRDSSVEELGVGNSVEEGDSCEEILDDDDDSEAIVVNDTKSLAQLAASATIANSSNSTIININTPPTTRKEQSKEPTLVIIDTNSILSGKGPIPIQKPTVTSTISNNSLQSLATSNSTTPKSNSTKDILLAPAPPKAGATINIPDDAFLIEAPSFIVPYVFEQSGQKVLKSYVKEIADEIKKEKAAADGVDEDIEEVTPKKKSEDYFESPVGKLLINLGMSLVQEYVQVDLLKLQRRKAEKERAKSRSGVPNIQTQQSIISLKNNIEESKENNEPFRHPLLKCKNCNFKTESELVMSTHLETPHMKNNCYRCNFCKHTTKLPNEILLHMEQDHKIRPRLERAPAVHQCPHCTFEDNSKAKLTRHLVSCTKRFRMDKNLEPPQDWDTPGKLPKMPKNRLVQQGAYNPGSGYVGGNTQQQQSQRSLLAQYPTMSSMANKYIQQGNRMQLPPLLQAPKVKPLPGLIRTNPGMLNPVNKLNQQTMPRGMIMRTASGQQVLTQPQIVGGQVIHQVIGNQLQMAGNSNAPKFLSNLGMAAGASNTSQRSASQLVSRNQGKNSQPSISITPLPRQSSIPAPAIASHSKPQGKASFVICEICDGYIKDLDQLRNHMQWIHKVKIHPKMIYNKPPLNCQKCQFRFFTDQGLERHLLGSHGLVTSSMQEAANKGQDNGRCPLCGKVYQWKLLAHVAKDHNVTLKPAHLSYKCTVCTATFGMYKLFESHVYSAHSMNSKRANSNNNSGRPLPSGSNNANNNRGQMQVTSRAVAPGGAGGNSFKPLKINDEITIIPQPLANATPLRTKGSLTITPHNANNARRSGRTNGDDGIEIIEIDEASNGRTSKENGEYRSLTESTSLRKRNLDISVCGTDSDNSDDSYQRAPTPAKRLRGN